MSNLNNDGYNEETTYVSEPAYTAPVAETVVPERSFLSRFWWLLPLLALLIALPFILRGCNRPVGTPAAPPVEPVVTQPAPVEPAQPTAPVEDDECTVADPCVINFRWWGGDARQALQLEAIAAFEAAHPGITINPEPTSLDGYFDALSIQMAAGNEPDVFALGGAWPLDYGRAGTLYRLDGNPNIDLAPFNPNILVDATVDGHVFAVPTGGNATGLVINPRLFEEAGVALPNDDTWTWEEFVDIANQISANTPAGTFGVEIRPQDMLGSFVAQRDGVGLYTAPDANGHQELNLPAAQEALTAYFEMVQQLEAGGGMPPAALSSELSNVGPEETLMGRGLGAMIFAPSNQIGAFADASGDDLMLVRIPGETQFASVGVAVLPSQWLAVGANSAHPTAAVRFVDWMVNSTDAGHIMRVDRGNPLNSTVAAAIAGDLTPMQEQQVNYMGRISQYAGHAIPQPPGAGEQPTISISSQEAVLFGQMTPEQAAASWVSRMQTELAAAN